MVMVRVLVVLVVLVVVLVVVVVVVVVVVAVVEVVVVLLLLLVVVLGVLGVILGLGAATAVAAPNGKMRVVFRVAWRLCMVVKPAFECDALSSGCVKIFGV